MTYTPIHERVLPIFIFYMVLIVFSVIMTLRMYQKWRERKVKPPFLLFIVFLILTTALASLTIGLGETVITGYFMEVYRFSLPFAYATIILADIFLFRFAIEITNKGKKGFLPLIIVGIIIIIILWLPWNWWGIPAEDYAGELNIRLYSTISVVIYSYVIYIYIALISYNTSKQASDKIAKTGLKFLFYSMIAMILFFVMVIMDTLLITLFDHPGYSEFMYIAWCFAILFYILTYLSLVMPDWLKKRIMK